MTVSTEKHEIMITLIRNSCKCLYEWAQKTENPKMKWLAENILMRSEIIYSNISSVNAKTNEDEYKNLSEKLLKIKAYVDKLFIDLNDIIENSKYDYLWEYFTEITNSNNEYDNTEKDTKHDKFEINESYEINGFRVSDCGIENDRLDYNTLFKLVGNAVWNGEIVDRFDPWEFVQKPKGFKDWGDAEIDAWYIVNEDGATLLEDYTDELLIYCYPLDMYVWGLIGTGYIAPDFKASEVLTNIKLSEMKKVGA